MPWSSYQRIILEKPSKLKKQEVIDWFRDKDKYLEYHADIFKKLDFGTYFIEDD